jgi:hypothetical protein
MPLDNTGAPAPRSPWAQRLACLKILRRKANKDARKQRRFSQARLRSAEQLIAHIIDNADIVAESPYTDLWQGQTIFLLVALSPGDFDRLAEYGSELEDAEDTNDAETTEADEGEHDLGRSERVAQPEEYGGDDAEPSFGSTSMIDQRRWAKGPVTDREGDPCDQGEPDYEGQPSLMSTTGADLLGFDGTDLEADPCDQGEAPEYPLTAKDEAIIEPARSRYETAAGAKVVAWPSRDPLTGKAGAWLLQRRQGGAK